MGLLLVAGSPITQLAAACYVTVCAVQIVLTETLLGTPERFRVRLARIAAFPLACAVHGTGGICGWARLLAGASGAGKTERGSTA